MGLVSTGHPLGWGSSLSQDHTLGQEDLETLGNASMQKLQFDDQ